MSTSSVIDAAERQQIAYTRQADWFDPADHPHARATLLGVGGIGSPVALALAKLGIPHLTLIDPDYVERHNLPNQMMPMHGEGRFKVDAVADVILDFSPTEVETYVARITEEGWAYPDEDVIEFANPGRPSGIVIVSPDNMPARADMWKQVKYNPYVPLLLDGRMGGQNVLLYAVNPCDPDDIEYYESTLYSDEEARPLPCTASAVIDVGFMIASLVTRAVRKHYAGEQVERMIYVDQDSFIIGKE